MGSTSGDSDAREGAPIYRDLRFCLPGVDGYSSGSHDVDSRHVQSVDEVRGAVILVFLRLETIVKVKDESRMEIMGDFIVGRAIASLEAYADWLEDEDDHSTSPGLDATDIRLPLADLKRLRLLLGKPTVTYEETRRASCEYCRDNWPKMPHEDYHWTGKANPPLCTAPSRREFMAQQARRIADLEAELAASSEALKISRAQTLDAFERVANLHNEIAELRK